MPFIAGWGNTAEDGTASEILQHVQVPIIETSKCERNYRRIDKFDLQFDDRVLCAGFDAGKKDSCDGDSGGPLMLPIYSPTNGEFPFYQLGVVSYGIGCAVPNVPGVYTNVSTYIDWIEKTLHT